MGRGRHQNEKRIVPYAEVQAQAYEKGLAYLDTELLQAPSEQNNWTAIVKCVVANADGTLRRSGLGDASPNEEGAKPSSPAATATVRQAETRSKARAMKEYIHTADLAAEEMPGHFSNERRNGVATNERRLKLAQLISAAGRDVEKFEQSQGALDQIDAEATERWIKRLEQELAKRGEE